MNISLNWLSDYIEWKLDDPHAIADRMTLCIAEVEEVIDQGAMLTHCCVGKITSVKQHPNADRLKLCTVETDKGDKQVVCGGTNLEEDMLVAFAHIGATVSWHGEETVTLEKTKIRGEVSEGMICAAEELGIEDLFPTHKEDGERPIVNLSRSDVEFSVGQGLREALGRNDVVLDLNNTGIAHRPDLFSHMGIARECVATGIAEWKGEYREPTIAFTDTPLPFGLSLEEPDMVPGYAACIVKMNGQGETPDWMKQRLEATGWRSKGLLIDITNYVMMEWGVPLHSFDADSLQGDIAMRASADGEIIEVLDGSKHKLGAGAAVMSDDNGVFDVLGIMGGKRSGTTDDTTRILLHAPVLNPAYIRRGIRMTGLRTDAATVYEKGVPLASVQPAFLRALQLVLELAPGAAIDSECHAWGTLEEPAAIELREDKLERSIGSAPDATMVEQTLQALGCGITTVSGGWSVQPPAWRGDLRIQEDLIEELARIHGYDHINPVLPHAPLQIPEHMKLTNMLTDTLVEQGYYEVVPLSLTSKSILTKAGEDTKKAVELASPLGEETAVLHTSALSGLLQHAARFMRHRDHDLHTFQATHVFQGTKEWKEMGLLHCPAGTPSLGNMPALQMRTNVQTLLEQQGFQVNITQATKSLKPFMHPGRTAEVQVDGKGVGHVFEVHPTVCTAFDLPQRTAAAILNVSDLEQATTHVVSFQPLPQHPAITYDETVTWQQKKALSPELANAQSKSDMLEDIQLISLFEPKEREVGEYRVSLRFTYRAPDKTLTEAEAKKEHSEVLNALKH